MIGVRAAANVRPEHVEDFVASAQKLVGFSRKDAGNLSYDFGALAEEGAEGQFAFIERWETQEALDEHMATEHFTAAVAEWENYLDSPLDVAIYDM